MKWKTALYDTLSLVMLDGALQRDSDLAGRLPGILAIEESFLPCHVRGDIAERMRTRTEVVLLPGPAVISGVLRKLRLPITIAGIDALTFVAAVHYDVAVVTSDARLEGALRS